MPHIIICIQLYITYIYIYYTHLFQSIPSFLSYIYILYTSIPIYSQFLVYGDLVPGLSARYYDGRHATMRRLRDCFFFFSKKGISRGYYGNIYGDIMGIWGNQETLGFRDISLYQPKNNEDFCPMFCCPT